MSSSTYDEVKPIETLYNGVTFRSRLEARWAVFFDMWGIEWQYEPEGFETAAGRWVPDFFLPQVSMMVEVKPTVAAVDQRVIARASAYLTALDSHPVLILPGQPRPINYPVMLGPVEAHADGLQWHIDRFYDQAEPDENGEPVFADMLMLIFAREILTRKPGSTFIGEVKCSQIMYDELERLGGRPIMY